MRYWLTTHYPWPPPVTWHVYLQVQFEDVGRWLGVGDQVLFYEFKHNPSGRERHESSEGKALLPKLKSRIRCAAAPDKRNLIITTGRQVKWPWEVPTRVEGDTGFVSQDRRIYRILQFESGYRMRGFGSRGSGVKELDEAQYRELMDLYQHSVPK